MVELELKYTEIVNGCSLLYMQVDHKCLDLLEHPVVLKLLNFKWIGLGLLLYLIQLFLFTFFMASLSALTLTLNHPLRNICSE